MSYEIIRWFEFDSAALSYKFESRSSNTYPEHHFSTVKDQYTPEELAESMSTYGFTLEEAFVYEAIIVTFQYAAAESSVPARLRRALGAVERCIKGWMPDAHVYKAGKNLHVLGDNVPALVKMCVDAFMRSYGNLRGEIEDDRYVIERWPGNYISIYNFVLGSGLEQARIYGSRGLAEAAMKKRSRKLYTSEMRVVPYLSALASQNGTAF
ncbi:hypothetical protein [Microbacterium suwonense]|uniref:Uncharacterized protein n=1 Tax=Microbacterium suwonense TaxID=683047 RepID=A0ABM8FW18_9MICO|nr:hypothetical protein [Microbacterium suwonense]BDZ39932.1 hypothetical protein GCM10025863_25460 [Microbacterium suwonense]